MYDLRDLIFLNGRPVTVNFDRVATIEYEHGCYKKAGEPGYWMGPVTRLSFSAMEDDSILVRGHVATGLSDV